MRKVASTVPFAVGALASGPTNPAITSIAPLDPACVPAACRAGGRKTTPSAIASCSARMTTWPRSHADGNASAIDASAQASRARSHRLRARRAAVRRTSRIQAMPVKTRTQSRSDFGPGGGRHGVVAGGLRSSILGIRLRRAVTASPRGRVRSMRMRCGPATSGFHADRVGIRARPARSATAQTPRPHDRSARSHPMRTLARNS